MNNIDLGSAASICASFLSMIGVVYLGAVKLTTIEVKVATMWNFLLRRAKGEAVLSGLADFNSPLVVKDSAKSLVPQDLRDKIVLAFADQPELSDVEMAVAIELRFGDEILREMCVPHGLYMGACLMICMAVVRDSHKASAVPTQAPEIIATASPAPPTSTKE